MHAPSIFSDLADIAEQLNQNKFVDMIDISGLHISVWADAPVSG